jgi:hypothetical protein
LWHRKWRHAYHPKDFLGGDEMADAARLLATACLATTIALSGCVAIGGSKMIGIRGVLPASAGECLLDFVVSDSGRVKMTQPVQGDFDVGVVLSGGVAQRYYFVARCPEARIYRSEETTIGMSDDTIQVGFLLANEQQLPN